jgi:hypothetical protein
MDKSIIVEVFEEVMEYHKMLCHEFNHVCNEDCLPNRIKKDHLCIIGDGTPGGQYSCVICGKGFEST